MRKFKLICALLPILFLGISASVSAQSIRPDENPVFNGEKKFTAGLAAGVNISQVDGDNLSGFSKVGMNVGPVLQIHFDEKVSLGLEILYSQKGSKSILSSNGGFGRYTLKLNYAEVPLVLYYNLQPKYQFGIGLSYNQFISAKETIDDQMNPVITLDNDNIYRFNKGNIDALISGSVVLWQGLVLQARYQYSLTPIRKFENTPYDFGLGGGDQKNNFFALRLMYLF